MKKISWHTSYLLDALYWSTRSHDSQTQCGCVLVAPDMTPISHGYNGFIRNIDDYVLPSVRPAKYPFMIHAEANAVYNACRQGKSTVDATAYITAEPCLNCLQALWQVGISKVVYSSFSMPKMVDNEEHCEAKKKLLKSMREAMKIVFISPKDVSSEPLEKTLKKLKEAQKRS
jgi:deoxycytidylate deaminase